MSEQDKTRILVVDDQLTEKIADDGGFMRGEAAEIMERLLEIIKERLITGEDVLVSGFGKWSVKDKRERRGRNPQTGEELVLDARKVVTWSYSPVLKKTVSLGKPGHRLQVRDHGQE